MQCAATRALWSTCLGSFSDPLARSASTMRTRTYPPSRSAILSSAWQPPLCPKECSARQDLRGKICGCVCRLTLLGIEPERGPRAVDGQDGLADGVTRRRDDPAIV